jgi:hypothetical protein
MTENNSAADGTQTRRRTSPVDYALVLGLLVLALWAGLEPMAEAFATRYAEAETSRSTSRSAFGTDAASGASQSGSGLGQP